MVLFCVQQCWGVAGGRHACLSGGPGWRLRISGVRPGRHRPPQALGTLAGPVVPRAARGRGLCPGSSLPALGGPAVVRASGPSMWEGGVVLRQAVLCEGEQGGGELCAWPGRGCQHRDSAGQRSPRGPVGCSPLPRCQGSPCPCPGGLSAAGPGRSSPSRAEADLGGPCALLS